VPDEFHFKPGEGKWGINLDAVDCPDCKERMPNKVRVPDNLHQLMWGGWTCPKCGCRMDKWGKE
jgi:ssDNA-binding Zn-finger/Zn-ribbon topoisomerase 1